MRVRSSIVVVTRETRLQNLRARWGTAQQAKFLLRQAHLHEAERQTSSTTTTARRARSAPPKVTADAELGYLYLTRAEDLA